MAPAAVLLIVLLSLAGWMADRAQASTEAAVAVAVREAAGHRLAAMPTRQLRSLAPGRLTVALQRHPEAVAALVVGHRAATLMMAAGPLAAAAMLAIASWQAAALVILLTPVMILFFALVGEAIRRRADAQERALGRLAGQFADRIRALPTLLANHALAVEESRLAARLDAYAQRSMGVLRVAFLNAGIIDFFASLSIAMLAVFLGLGHLKLAMIPGFSNLDLWQSLFILMVAPDYFAPFRRFSELYHAKSEGEAAARALDALLDAPPEGGTVLPMLDDARIDLPGRGLVAVVGPSGGGKSTLLRRRAGVEAGADGRMRPTLPGPVAWVATDSPVHGATLAEALAWPARDVAPERLAEAAAAVGLLDDALLPGGLATRLARDGGNLSGGQRLRIAMARAALSEATIVADEPTAKLDRPTAALVRDQLARMAQARLVVVATHDRDLMAAAELVIDVGALREPPVTA